MITENYDKILKKAWEYERSGEQQSALQQIEKAEKAGYPVLKAVKDKMRISNNVSDYDSSIREYERIKYNKNKPEDIIMQYAVALIGKRFYKQALKFLTPYINKKKPSPHLYIEYARALMQSGQYLKAKTVLKKITGKHDTGIALPLLADISRLQGQLKTAEKYLKSYISGCDGDEYSLKMLASIYINMKRYEDVISVLCDEHIHSPLDAAMLKDLAISYAMSGKYKEAESTTDRALSLYPENIEILNEAVFIYYRSRSKAKVIETLRNILDRQCITKRTLKITLSFLNKYKEDNAAKEKVLSLLRDSDSGDSDILFEIGKILYRYYGIPVSVKYFEKSLNKDAVKAGKYLYVFKLLLSDNQYDELYKTIRRSPDEIKSLPETKLYLAEIHERNKDYSKALEIYTELNRKKQLNKVLLADRIFGCSLKTGSYDRAVSCIQNVPPTEEYYAKISYVYLKLDNIKASIRYAVRAGIARKVNRNFIDPLIDRLIETQEYKTALELIDKLIGASRPFKEYRLKKAFVYIKRSEFKQAVKELKKAKRSYPVPAELYYLMSLAYSGQGKDRAAEANIKKAAELEPESADYVIPLAGIQAKGNNPEEKDEMIDSLMELSGKDPDIVMKKAELLADAGREQKAKEILSTAIKRDRREEEKDIFKENKILSQLEELEAVTRLKSQPTIMAIHLTNRCNINCIMCRRGKSWDLPEKTAEEIKGFMPYLEHISWLGGEVFLYNGFRDMFKKAIKYRHIKNEIVSNGLLIDKEWASLFAESETELFISMDSTKKNVYEKIRKGGDYKKLLENIKLINNVKSSTEKGKLTTGIYFVLMRSNYEELPLLADFFSGIGINKLKLLRVTGYPEEDIFRDIDNKSKARIKDDMQVLKENCEKKGVKLFNMIDVASFTAEKQSDVKKIKAISQDILPLKRCRYPWRSIIIRMGGDVAPWCDCRKAAGNVEDNSIKDIWNNKVMQEYRCMLNKGDKKLCIDNCISRLQMENIWL